MSTTCSQEIYESFDASHDYAHIERVLKNAEKIMATEPSANKRVVRLAALLHDIDDPKYKSNENPSVKKSYNNWCNEELAKKVLACIESVSFSGGNEKEITSIEGAIIRDADRLGCNWCNWNCADVRIWWSTWKEII